MREQREENMRRREKNRIKKAEERRGKRGKKGGLKGPFTCLGFFMVN